MKVIPFEHPAAALAEAFAQVLNECAAPRVAVSGGSTPRSLFRILAEDYRDAVPWERLHLFQVDERCVPPEDERSNWRMLRGELLAKLPGITAYRIEAERDGAAEDYERIIREIVPAGNDGIPCFDLVLLGMGTDGHTASLFPGTAALEERRRLVVKNPVPQLDTMRVTMTFPLINAAARKWFLVTGADKAEVLARVKRGELPAARVRDAEWFIDRAAATATP